MLTPLSRPLLRLPLPSITLTRTLHTTRPLQVQPTDNPLPANDPNAKPPAQTVSATSAVPTSSQGSWDRTLVESVEDAEKKRTMQAPNRKGIWSRSQMPRELAMVGPRFEQIIYEDQVCFVRVCFCRVCGDEGMRGKVEGGRWKRGCEEVREREVRGAREAS